jgi:hypothetical protein
VRKIAIALVERHPGWKGALPRWQQLERRRIAEVFSLPFKVIRD